LSRWFRTYRIPPWCALPEAKHITVRVGYFAISGPWRSDRIITATKHIVLESYECETVTRIGTRIRCIAIIHRAIFEVTLCIIRIATDEFPGMIPGGRR